MWNPGLARGSNKTISTYGWSRQSHLWATIIGDPGYNP